MKKLALMLPLLLTACDYAACNPEQAQKAGEYYSKCLQGDGYVRPSHAICSRRAYAQQFCSEK